jgi:hypothetical protein
VSRGMNVRKVICQAMRGGLLVFRMVEVLFDKMGMLGLGIELVKVHMPSIGILHLSFISVVGKRDVPV